MPILMIAVLLLFPANLYAYLDPGTGSYFFQILLAALVGVLYGFRRYLGKIRSYLNNLLGRKKGKFHDP